MRRALVALALALATPAPAAAAVSLAAHPSVPRYGTNVTLSGAADPGATIELFFEGAATGASVSADAATGEFAFQFRATQPGSYHVEAEHDSSPAVKLKIRPLLSRHLAGLPYPGNRLLVKGRLRPAGAASLTLGVGTRSRHVRIHAGGRYAATLPTDRIGRHRLRLVLDAQPGYKSFTVRRRFLVRAPSLSVGSRGRAVLALERRLKSLRHVLRGVDHSYRTDTYEAVLAFQKVHGMARTGRVSHSVWAALGRAHVPRARVAQGNHVEVSKTLQVMYEVRKGKVVRVVHVSTGATGNTPVGKWHVYSKVPGFNAIGMYYSLFFTGAFAIHGYHSVPAYPASHGCVRTPLWFAPGFYSRWAAGTTVYIFG